MQNNALKWLPIILLLAFCTTALSLCLSSQSNSIFAFVYFSYYILLIILCLWSVSTVFLLSKSKPIILFKQNWAGILSAIILTGICFFFIDSWFRLLSDETNILSVAQGMAHQKKVFLTEEGRIINENLYPIIINIPKRPLLFSFILSLIHNVSGYSFENAFFMNLGCLFMLLCLVFFAIKPLTGTAVAISVQVLLVSQPVIPIYATSAGFDLFAALFFCLSLFSAYIFMREKDVKSFSFLWCNLLMFANIRYESFVFMGLIISFLFSMRYITRDILLKNSFLIGISPLLFIPRILQPLIRAKGVFENPEGIVPFSIQNLLNYTLILIKSQFDFSRILPYATILNLVSFLLFLMIILLTIKKFNSYKNWQKHFILLALVCTCFVFIIYLSYYMGSCAHPATVRFFLIPAILSSLIPAFYFSFRPKKSNCVVICCLSILTFSFYFPTAIENRLINTQFAVHDFREAYTFLKKQSSRNLFIISNTPSQFIPLNFSAVNFKTANKYKHLILREFHNKIYENIFIFQTISSKTNIPLPENSLDSVYNLKPVYKFKSLTGNVVLVSKIILGNGSSEKTFDPPM